ncbi:unnamed protein product [Vitrella brassicaformis CCMP3155]|uniref:Uncharacterized protein n=1 Tax=Vitrella brassicaformis (strain CCMP3155) TaxID=1169540 RepID=A0A0G4EMV3_VITBC|nr:unnamed protein product [Vitrella brassicaformis CCMP3155]|eukprot:CEL98347.1 unnamed protein product [Vitrella brassicaformis CCMP3155]
MGPKKRKGLRGKPFTSAYQPPKKRSRSLTTGANKRLKAESHDDESDRHSEPDVHQHAGEGAEDDALMDQLDDGQEANRHADLDEMEGGEDGDAEVGTAKKRGRGSLGGEGRGWDDEVDEDMHDGPVDEIEEEEEVPPKPPTPPGEPSHCKSRSESSTYVGCDGQSSAVVSDLVKLLQLKPHGVLPRTRREG